MPDVTSYHTFLMSHISHLTSLPLHLSALAELLYCACLTALARRARAPTVTIVAGDGGGASSGGATTAAADSAGGGSTGDVADTSPPFAGRTSRWRAPCPKRIAGGLY